MIDSPISRASLQRQIAREGERWGLVPEWDEDMGVMRVVEVSHIAEARNGLGEVLKGPNRRICSVNDESPFSGALRNRVKNGEFDLAARYRKYDQMVKADEARAKKEMDDEIRRRWASRRRITVLPDGIVPAGIAERARRAKR